MRNIFLHKNKNINSVNKESSCNIELSSNIRLIPDTNIKEKFDLFEEYNMERDNCPYNRLIINVFPYMTNCLYNRRTEIINKEGSPECYSLAYKPASASLEKNISQETITWSQALKNTEYSHPDTNNFTYHCGLDIFDNHRLRSNSFKVFDTPQLEEEGDTFPDFNTMGDFQRNSHGFKISETISTLDDENQLVPATFKKHAYIFEEIDDFTKTFDKKYKVKDGWSGFINPTVLKIEEKGTKPYIDRLLCNRSPMAFIDLYPDRTLFSLLPKYNQYFQRAEANWEYSIMYPFESDKNKFNELNGNTINALKTVKDEIKLIGSGGVQYVQFKSYFKHNLKQKSLITLYYQIGDKNKFYQVPFTSRIVDVGDMTNKHNDPEHYFAIKADDVASFLWDSQNNIINSEYNVFFRRFESGYLCEYYFRKFKHIDSLKSESGRIAFNETIFGDNALQVLFQDIIDVSDLKNNRGGEVTDLYFAIIKRNKGYKEWYSLEETANKASNPAIEFSHCFGPVTSGLDLPPDATDYNVHKLHNIDLTHLSNGNSPTINYTEATKLYFANFLTPEPKESLPLTLEGELNGESDEIYGDVVEYSPARDVETVIEKVYHRFNTAQRECVDNSKYFNFVVHEFARDDYGLSKNDKFEISENDYSLAYEKDGINYFRASNLAPEGYYYCPLYKIEIRRREDSASRSQGQMINCDYTKTSIEKYFLNYETGRYEKADPKKESPTESTRYLANFISPKDYNFSIDDNFLLYDRLHSQHYWGRLIQVDNRVDLYIDFGEENIEEINTDRYNLVLLNRGVPTSATFLNNTTHEFVWRKTLKFSDLGPKDELFSTPFANGCLYFEVNIPFYLRRQDPFGEYGLNKVNEKKMISVFNNFTSRGEKYSTDNIDYISALKNTICM